MKKYIHKIKKNKNEEFASLNINMPVRWRKVFVGKNK